MWQETRVSFLAKDPTSKPLHSLAASVVYISFVSSCFDTREGNLMALANGEEMAGGLGSAEPFCSFPVFKLRLRDGRGT